MKNIITVTLLLLSVSTISANTLSLDPNGDDAWNVNYISDGDMGGFQFNVDGATVTSASGGSAGSAGFVVSTAGSMVLGFSFTGATISAGSGTLVVLNVAGTPTGLSGIIVSDPVGQDMGFTYDDGGGDGPSEFAFNQSTQQSAYFFESVTLDGIPIEPDDWVGAFNGDICVGA
ncbi:MAG: hypothetical protein QF380_07115, partial [Candidatus Marinimicrobia bacterium]|nr:hypothetical protein [Candidatus Neomarinimicrobiota bacterium]